MPGPDTPRVMSVLGASQLLAGAPAAALLYVHFELVGVIARVAGSAVRRCTHAEELMVCNFLLAAGRPTAGISTIRRSRSCSCSKRPRPRPAASSSSSPAGRT